MAIAEIPSVNFHLWEPCNMRCRFCFATFQDVKRDILPKGHMPKQDCIAVIDSLARAGFEKLTFAGGEPTLCPWLPDLIQHAKESGFTTAVVTNGSNLTEGYLHALHSTLDWVALSIDTADPEKLERSGRTLAAGPLTEDGYLHLARMVRQEGMRLKINTVVTALNWEKDFTGFITRAKPERWKILQVLPVAGQNDRTVGELTVTEQQFNRYVARNRKVEREGIVVVPEGNAMMRGSYVMVDPAGRFFDNHTGQHTYSRPIAEAGVSEALKQVHADAWLFHERGGFYNW